MSDAEEPPRRKRRLGFRRACIPCRQKKHRCDGGKPSCLGCVGRGIRCQYGPSGSVRDDVDPSPRPRPPASSISLNVTHGSPTEERLLRSRSPIWASSVSESVNGNIPSPAPQLPSQPQGYFGDSSSFRFVSGIKPDSHLRPGDQTPPSESLLSRELCESPNATVEGASQSKLSFPPHELADRLVDAYFERVHVLYPFVHEGRFRARYERLWADNPGDEVPPTAWLAIVNLIFAYGHEFCATHQVSFAAQAAPFIDRARALLLSRVFRGADLQLVQALLLLCHYLQGTLQLDECWNLVGLMIRSAVSIGLHLDPGSDGSLSAVDVEERKRVWWGCFVLDRTLSMKFGRPPSIQFESARDVGLPLEVDDQYISETSLIPRQPWGRPARLAFFIHTIKLSEVVDNILSGMYDTGRASRELSNQKLWWARSPEASTRLGNAVLLDGQLRAWWDSRPAHLKDELSPPDGKELQCQQLVMRIRFLQMRLLLQRPSFMLFRQNKIDDEFLRGVALSSSRVCVAAARETIRLIHLHYDKQLLNSLWYNLHYIFTSLGVLVTVQTMEASLKEQLSSVEDAQALHCGMEFLRSASRNSILASRYISMLSKPNKTPRAQSPNRSDHILQSQEQGQRSELNNGSIGTAVGSEEIPATDTSVVAQNGVQPQLSEQDGLDGVYDDLDFAHLDSMYLYDLLFGTGLPQEVLSTDWPTSEIMIQH